MVIALATGLYSTLLRAGLMDMDKMSAYVKTGMKDIQDRRKDAKERDDQEALDAIQEEQMEAMGDQLGMFKEQFRPMVWIMFLTIPAFLWMFWVIGYRGSTAAYPPSPLRNLSFRSPVPSRGTRESSARSRCGSSGTSCVRWRSPSSSRRASTSRCRRRRRSSLASTFSAAPSYSSVPTALLNPHRERYSESGVVSTDTAAIDSGGAGESDRLFGCL